MAMLVHELSCKVPAPYLKGHKPEVKWNPRSCEQERQPPCDRLQLLMRAGQVPQ